MLRPLRHRRRRGPIVLQALCVDGSAVSLREGNKACLALVKNLEATGLTKHVGVASHVVRSYVARGDVASLFHPCSERPSDGLTRPLPGPAFNAVREATGVGPDLGVGAGAPAPSSA